MIAADVARARGADADARATARRGAARIAELAARIEDPDARSSFLERVPEHVALRRAAAE